MVAKRVVFVTGGTGFIGRHVLPHLVKKGYEVHASFIENQLAGSLRLSGVHWHRLDVMDYKRTASLLTRLKPTHLLHLAWVTQHRTYWTSPENIHWVQASLRLLRSFHAAGGRRVVMAGTCAEYQWAGGVCREGATPLRPSSLYGASRHALQLMCDAYARGVSLSCAWGRIFFLFGPHEYQERLVPSAIRSLLEGREFFCSHGHLKRDFLYVEDVARAFVALLGTHVQGPVNIGSGRAVSLKEVVTKISRLIGRPDLVRFGAKKTDTDNPAVLVADVQRLNKEVGWKPRYDLEDALKKAVAWWRHRSDD